MGGNLQDHFWNAHLFPLQGSHRRDVLVYMPLTQRYPALAPDRHWIESALT